MAKSKHKKGLRRRPRKAVGKGSPAAGGRSLLRNPYFPLLVIFLVGVVLAWWTWGAWADAMVDFGRELYIPWQITQGQTLYTDLAYFNGPLSPHVNALWFGVLGLHMRTLVVANLCVLAGITVLLYRLLLSAGGRWGATAGCLLFLGTFAFCQYGLFGNANFVTPYSHEMTHGMLLSLTGLVCLSRFQHRRRWTAAAGAGLALGLVFLTKAEIFLAAGGALLAGMAATLWLQRPPWRTTAAALAAFLGGLVLPPVCAFLLLSARMPAGQALAGTLGSWPGALNPHIRGMYFYRWTMGTDQPARNLGILLKQLGQWAAVVVPAVGVALAFRRGDRRGLTIGALAAVAVLIAGYFSSEWLGRIAGRLLRPLPAVLAGMLVAAGWMLWRQRRGPDEVRARTLLRLTLVGFSLLLLPKILLRVMPAHYGFALAMPGAVVAAAVLVDWLPAALQRRRRAGWNLRLIALAVLTVYVGLHLWAADHWYGVKNVTIRTATAAFRTDARGNVIKGMLAAIEEEAGDDQTLAVLPEGVMLNVLSGRRNPTPYVNFMPPEFALFGETAMLEAFRASPPDFIVLVNRTTDEYDVKGFGRDFGVRLHAWVRENYVEAARIADPTLADYSFSEMALLKRRP